MAKFKKSKKIRPALLVGAGAAATAAFVPGAAEAHCGHGMWGVWIWVDYSGWMDSGCTGKGDQPQPDYICNDDPEYGQPWICWNYYNCYEPC
jgi:hypothetical protein